MADFEKPPAGIHKAEHKHLYASRIRDPLIQLDMVSPSIEGYFRIPAVWIGEAPAPETVRKLNPAVHHAIMYQHKLDCGIEVRVQRDGLFLFDFRNWALAPQIIIPGYTRPNPNGPYSVPQVHTKAEEKAEEFAIVRAQLMNAHQACLATAESVVMRRGAAMGFPVTAWNTHKAISFETKPSYHDDTEDIHALARNVLNNKDGVEREYALQRRALELPVVEESFRLLDLILRDPGSRAIQMVESAYIAACRNVEKRFGEAVVISWGVCEQLISVAWKRHLDSKRTEPGRVTKDREEKLTGRDYTASVRVEMLELSGVIDHEQYRRLEIARKARNKWAHEMRVPKQSEVSVCIKAIEILLLQVEGIPLRLQLGGRGGVPEWPAWMAGVVQSIG